VGDSWNLIQMHAVYLGMYILITLFFYLIVFFNILVMGLLVFVIILNFQVPMMMKKQQHMLMT
jgi:hypothetical protein